MDELRYIEGKAIQREANPGKGTKCVVLWFRQKVALLPPVIVLPEQQQKKTHCVFPFEDLFFFASPLPPIPLNFTLNTVTCSQKFYSREKFMD